MHDERQLLSEVVVMPNHSSTLCGQRRPMIDESEVGELAETYGVPIRRRYEVKAGGSILQYRWRKDTDRRAEVIFAIQGPGEQIWLHTKHRYERPMFRLPTGGIDWDEPVLAALLREIKEEAGVAVKVERFVALLEYQFYQVGAQATERAVGGTQSQAPNQGHLEDAPEPSGTRAGFASYLFLVKNLDGQLAAHDNEEVAEFKPIMPRQLIQVAADLRNVLGPRREWGHWRAISHDVLYEAMCK